MSRPAFQIPRNAKFSQKLAYPIFYIDAFQSNPPYRPITRIIYVLFAGWLFGLAYLLAALLLLLSIIFIPYGIQTLRFVPFVVWPFGRSIVRGDAGQVMYEGLFTRLVHDRTHPFTIFANGTNAFYMIIMFHHCFLHHIIVVWLLAFGWLLILGRLVAGVVLVLSVVGFAAGMENFRAIPWTAWPFGSVVAQIATVPDYPPSGTVFPPPPNLQQQQFFTPQSVV